MNVISSQLCKWIRRIFSPTLRSGVGLACWYLAVSHTIFVFRAAHWSANTLLARLLDKLFTKEVARPNGNQRLQNVATDINSICVNDTIPKHSPNNNLSSKLQLSAFSILLFFTNTVCGIPIEQDTNSTSTSTYPTPLTAPLSGTEINKGPRSKEPTWIVRIVLIAIAAAIFLAALLSICTRRAPFSIRLPGRMRGTAQTTTTAPVFMLNAGAPGAPANPANVPPLGLLPVLHTPANTNPIQATATVTAVIVHAEVVAVDVTPLDADTTLKDIVF